MAIINSAGVGKAVKSQGNLTYKTIRGRTIASSKILTNKSNTSKQQIARSDFAAFSSICQKLSFYISNLYEKSKYGSARNHFMTVNKVLLKTLSGLTVDDIRSESVAASALRLVDTNLFESENSIGFNSVGSIPASFVSGASPSGTESVNGFFGLGTLSIVGNYQNSDPLQPNYLEVSGWCFFKNSKITGQADMLPIKNLTFAYNESQGTTDATLNMWPDDAITNSIINGPLFVLLSIKSGSKIVQISRPFLLTKA